MKKFKLRYSIKYFTNNGQMSYTSSIFTEGDSLRKTKDGIKKIDSKVCIDYLNILYEPDKTKSLIESCKSKIISMRLSNKNPSILRTSFPASDFSIDIDSIIQAISENGYISRHLQLLEIDDETSFDSLNFL